jgi:signal transduction histidine kinase
VAGSGDPATTGGGSRIEEGGHPPSPILDPQFSALVAEAARLEEEMDLAYFREHLERMCDKSLQGLQRVRDIVRNLRDFAHLDEAEFKEADLNAALESAIEILRHEIKTRGLQLQEQLHPLPPLLCHPGKINQVFLNLLANAVQACETGGTITVRSRLDPRSSILDPRSSEILDSRQGVVIEVEDTGCGIKPEHLPRIFEPFFTTKPVGQGTGLGLAVSFGIVRDHGGTIEVESSPGRGSTFRVRLPLHPHQPGEAPREGETSRETTP